MVDHQTVLTLHLRKADYKVEFYPVSTVGELSSLKDPQFPEKKAGVYRVACGQCHSFYIGQTGRSMKKRIGEHNTAFYSGKFHESAIAEHCHSSGHDIGSISAKLLHSSHKSVRLNRLEEI